MIRAIAVLVTLLVLATGCSYFSPQAPSESDGSDTVSQDSSRPIQREETTDTEGDLRDFEDSLSELNTGADEEEPDVDFSTDF